MDGYQIALICVTILLLIAGGQIKRLAKELKELMDVVRLALEDKKVTKAELKSIIKEAKDVKTAITDIIKLVSRKRV